MGRDHRVINAPEFRGGQMTSVMGRSELDLRTATIAPGQDVTIEVFMLMGGATIRVPGRVDGRCECRRASWAM